MHGDDLPGSWFYEKNPVILGQFGLKFKLPGRFHPTNLRRADSSGVFLTNQANVL
jgi:hypothetical protein